LVIFTILTNNKSCARAHHTHTHTHTHTHKVWICKKCAFSYFCWWHRCIIFRHKEFDCILFQNLIFIPVIESPMHVYTKELACANLYSYTK